MQKISMRSRQVARSNVVVIHDPKQELTTQSCSKGAPDQLAKQYLLVTHVDNAFLGRRLGARL